MEAIGCRLYGWSQTPVNMTLQQNREHTACMQDCVKLVSHPYELELVKYIGCCVLFMGS